MSENVVNVPAIVSKKIHIDKTHHFIRGDGLRLLYSELLYRFSIDQIKQFFNITHLAKHEELLTTLEIVEKIWTYGSMFPTEYMVNVINSFESFCIRMGVNAVDLLKEAHSELRYGTELPADVFSRAMRISSDMFGKPVDHRLWLISTHETLSRIIAKNSLFKVIRVKSDTEYQNVTIAFSLDKDFTGVIPNIDGDLWMIPKIKYAPLCINYPPFDTVSLIADCRSVKDIVDAILVIKNKLVYLNAIPVGRIVDFNEFLKKNEISLEAIDKMSSYSVVEITSSYECPVRKRKVLHTGCVYGAPLNIFNIKYKKIEKDTESTLSYFFRKLASPHPTLWNSIKSKHRKFLRCLDTKYEFVYHTQGDTIYCNDVLLVRNIPARILKKILLIHLDGHSTFERKVLLDDPEIVFDRTNPGLEIRMQRLKLVLDKCCPLFTIKRLERGVYTIESGCPVCLVKAG